MASTPPPVSQPAPLKCSDSPAPALHHPVPDLQSLQGAYVSNIERLEDRAERMSEAGSDLGEEIRKLQLEQKLSQDRLSSLRSAALSDDVGKPFATRSRGASTSSYGHANSIVDVNTTARWGGYSPTGYVTSPVGSLHSQSPAAIPLQRQRSGSKASRLGQVVHADDTVEEPDLPQSHESNNPRPRSVSSFTRQFDEMTQQILEGTASGQQQYDHMGTHPHSQFDDEPPQPYLDVPDRPETSLSTDTARQAGVLWDDFDGVHCPDAVPEEGPSIMSPKNRKSRSSTLMRSPPAPAPGVPPPPGEGMVFYPARVPQMLNLPKRLSKAPVADIQARRRTQLLDAMQSENRKSAPWFAENGTEEFKQKRKSRQSLANLPPQLRASAYFDQPAPIQEFEVKGESAEETLESILEASAFAPVSAFTDHPFAGHIGPEVYGPASHERSGSKADARKSRSTLNLLPEKTDARKSRSSLNLLDTRRNSNGDPLNKLKKRNSSADLGVLTVRATESRMSLGDELDEPDHNARGPEAGGDITPTRRSFDDDEEEAHPHEAVDEEEPLPEEQYFGPPTTLLAELQMRKQQQKNRNLTAATAFPNGMHATLLELDAVAEVEKKKRQGQKVNLAWEVEPRAPDDDDSDEDVPIGVLFPGSEGLVKKAGAPGAGQQGLDWDRPLGLIEKRQMEDNEPLSQRRTRLFGLDSSKRKTQMPLTSQSQPYLAVPSQALQAESDEEGEGETLAERLRRLKEQKALDAALGDDVRKSVISGDFANEMISQFGVKEDDDKSKPSPTPGEEEEETLGQRRARLQAEAIARGDANPLGTRPPLRGSMSLANILTANPLDTTNSARKVSDEQLLTALPQGSLLRQNAETKAKHDADKADRIKFTSTFGPPLQPLVANQQKAPELAVAAKIQAYKDQMAGVGVVPPLSASTARAPSMMFNPMGGMTPMTNTTLPGSRGSYFPAGNMGMAPPFGMPGMGMTPGSSHGATPQQMMAMNMSMMSLPGAAGMQNIPPAFQHPQLGGSMRQSSMVNMPMGMGQMGMNMGMGMQHPSVMNMMEPPMDTRQRDLIDRWRNNVF